MEFDGRVIDAGRPSAGVPEKLARHDGHEPVKRKKRVPPGLIADLDGEERAALRALATDEKRVNGGIFSSDAVGVGDGVLRMLAAKGHLHVHGMYRENGKKKYIQQYSLVAVSVARLWDWDLLERSGERS